MDLRERVVAACDEGDRHPRPRSPSGSRSASRLDPPPAAAAARDRLDRPEAARRRPAARPSTPRRPSGSARRSPPTPTPRWRSWPGPPASRCSTSAAGPGAGPAGHDAKKKSPRAAEQDRPDLKAERAAWRRGVRGDRPVPAGVPGRDRRDDRDGPPLRPRPARRAGRRGGAARPLEGVTLTAAVRLGGVRSRPAWRSTGRRTPRASRPTSSECLAPTLRPGDIVVMDNLSSHKTAEVERLIARGRGRGALPAGVQPSPYPQVLASGPSSAAASTPLLVS